MYEFLVKEETRLWRANADRFSAQGGSLAEIRLAELARRWWTQGEDILPWLQRAYLERTFPDFDPTSGRDDDMPYDVDHMIPYSDWGTDWRVFRNRLQNLKLFDDYQIEKIRWARSDVGNAIGNKWLVDFSVNRGWGNIAFAAKLETLNSEVKRDSNSQAGLLLRVFDQRNGANWQKASADGDHEWTQERLVTFQRAIEERSAWLYREFYRDLGFAEWESDGAEPIGQRG